MANREDDLLAQAIANTEVEIFSEATGKDLPSDEGGPGDRSVEEMGDGLEGQHEPEEVEAQNADGETGEGNDAGKDEGKGDEGRDRDPKTGQFLAKDKDGKAEGEQQQQQTQQQSDPKSKERVPLAELLNERKARQDLERQLKDKDAAIEQERAQSRSEFEKINARFDAILSGQVQPKGPQPAQTQQQTEQRDESDLLFEDPKRFVSDLRSSIRQDLRKEFVSADLARTHVDEGEKFTKAYEALTALPKDDPSARATVQRIFASPTPGRDIIKWHEQQVALREIGDPDQFREKTRQEMRDELAKDPEFRKQLMESMRGEATGAGTGNGPRAVTRLPRSLNGAAGGNVQPASQNSGGGRFSADGSDRGVFEDAFRDF